jgi:integrase
MPEAWTIGQSQAFLKTARSSEWYALFHLALTTGMRREELLHLFWGDIDLTTKTLMVKRSYAPGGTLLALDPEAPNNTRTVALTDWNMRVLEDHRSKQQTERELSEDQWVFGTDVLTPLDSGILMEEFKRITDLTGLPNSNFHDLRHSSLTLGLLAGVDSDVLNERLGHSRIQALKEQHEAAANAVGSLLKVVRDAT